MDQERPERAWPLVCVLACLVILVVAWPRSRDQVARFGPPERPGRRAAAGPSSASTAPATWTEAVGAYPQSATDVGQVAKARDLQLAAVSGKLASCPIPLTSAPLSVTHVALPLSESSLRVEPPTHESATGDLEVPREEAGPLSGADFPPAESVASEEKLAATDILPAFDAPENLNAVGDPVGLSDPDELAMDCRRGTSRPAWDGRWPEPTQLLDRLDAVAWDCDTGPWARRAIRRVRRLNSASSPEELLSIFERLDASVREAARLAAGLEDFDLAARLRQAQHALDRRVALWRLAQKAGGLSTTVHDPVRVGVTRLSECLGRAADMPGDPAVVRQWTEYLELDAVEQLIADKAPNDRQALQTQARRTLRRLDHPGLSLDQRALLAGEPFVQLRSELRRQAAEPLDLRAVLAHVEQYECTGTPHDAQRVTEDRMLLERSPKAAQRELASLLAARYRDANVRLVVTGEMIERMLPDREPEFQWVRDRVMGTPVRGQSLTSAELGVRLIPDSSRLRMTLEVEGLVSALTKSKTGPATFWSDSQSVYVATKEVEVGPAGLRVSPAEVDVDNAIRLRSVSTTLDVIPLIGAVAQEVAQSQHEKSQPEMRREVERKVARQASRKIDEEVDGRLDELEAKLRDRVFAPLAGLSLSPKLVDCRTTEARMTVRLRLAHDDQLAGHTCRPWAPSDSLVSCQVHESALNNAIQRMGLDGGTFTLAEVRSRLAEALHAPEILENDPGRDDVQVTFAAADAVRVRCREGRLAVHLSIARLSKSPSVWKDFQVRAVYRPNAEGLRAELVRDGIVELDAAYSLRSQIPLRGVFSKVFHRDEAWKLTPDRLADDPRMADLAVTQLVIEDGWIGIALGPRRAESRPAVAQRGAVDVD